jgi:acetyl esterase/lipase
MLHGLPGNEQNLDLARAIQRAGWTVIAFHYRGAWGSGGTYSLAGGVDDARALLALLRQPERARAWGVDPKRIVLVGHSYGGYVAAAAMAQEPGVSGGVLIAPWDISEDARAWSHLTPEARRAAALDNFNDVNGRLTGADAVSLTEEVMAVGPRLDLAKTAAAIADRPLLVLTATRDTVDDQAKALLPALRSAHAAHLRVAQMQTDHGFDDSRIALEAAVLRWLAQFTAQVR